jgi:hypothetical protein
MQIAEETLSEVNVDYNGTLLSRLFEKRICSIYEMWVLQKQ